MVNEMYFVVPRGFDDPHRPSGGNAYDVRVARDLAGARWRVHLRPVALRALGVLGALGGARDSLAGTRDSLAGTLGALPDGSTVLVDGLVGSAAEDAMLPHSRRLRLVALVHLPLGAGRGGFEQDESVWEETRQAESAVLKACQAVICTSEWTRRWLVTQYGLAPARLWIARPGADEAAAVGGSPSGSQLLCVGALTPVKGQDLLLEALTALRDLDWCCTMVGPLDRDAGFVARLREQAERAGIADRVRLVGPTAIAQLEATYAASDLLVLASRVESFGMVVSEALAFGLPVVATDVGGIPEAFLGAGSEASPGAAPGALVSPEGSGPLTKALREWLTQPQTRLDWREAAQQRRLTVPRWTTTVDQVSQVLAEVSA
jgi:glycosyltransferase involved in cell wall biosynthesis